jgi:hypothetical protein
MANKFATGCYFSSYFSSVKGLHDATINFIGKLGMGKPCALFALTALHNTKFDPRWNKKILVLVS